MNNNSYEKIMYYIDGSVELIKAVFANAGDSNSVTPEELARLIKKLITIVRNEEDGQLYIYNINGKYDVAEEWLLQSIFKYILNNAGYSWNLKLEHEALGALKRDSTIIIKGFNNTNSVNFTNGVFYLDSGNLIPHSANNSIFTSILEYKYDKKAKCPNFEKFINETTCFNKQLKSVIQEIFGYCLSTKTNSEKAFFFYGTGCNGKSVLDSIMQSVIGEEQTCAISLDALNKTFSMTGFIGKRLNIAAENENLSNSEKLKTLISCDRINIPVKYHDDWTGKLYCKHIFLMNSLPTTPDVTNGFFRKLMIIPFNNIVSPENIDTSLPKKLLTELSGIFNWAYEGYLRLISNKYKFTKCDVIEKIMNEYKTRENPTGEFFHSKYLKDSSSKIKKSLIYEKYVDWSADMGQVVMSRNKFYNALQLKASETNSDIELDYRKINGYMYLVGYREKDSLIGND